MKRIINIVCMISSASLRRGAFTFVIYTTNAAWGQKHFLVEGCSGLLWGALGCSRFLWAALGCSGVFWATPGNTNPTDLKMHRGIVFQMVYFGLPNVKCSLRAVLGCCGLLWAALGCLGLLRAAPGCFGLLWAVLGHPWKHESD